MGTMEAGRELRIGELAERAGVTLQTLRYYESLGLIQPSPRRPGGFRFYGEDALQRLERIRDLKELLGFTLDEVRTVLAFDDAVATLRARYLRTEDTAERTAIVREAAQQTEGLIALVERKQAGLVEMRARLQERLERYHRLLGEMVSP